MATKFNPLKFYAFNNVKVLSDPNDLILYADGVDPRKRFEALLAQIKASSDPNFEDLIRLITGLGFVIIPGKFGVLSDPIPLFNRSSIFNSSSPLEGKTKIMLLPNQKEELGEVIYKLFSSSNIENKIHQDKNFFIPDIEQFGVSVDVIATKANVLDIYENDQFFTNGELSSTKQETSLTYAYAFETFEVQGTQELVKKTVDLAFPNNEEFFKQANNESQNSIIDKLKNILYDGENTADIEKFVLQDDSIQDIGVNKLYNVVTVEIPKLQSNHQKNNILDYVNAYKSKVNPPSNSQTFLGASSLLPSGLNELEDLITQLSFFISTATPQELTTLVGYNFNLDIIELAKSRADFLAKSATNKDVNLEKIAKFKELLTYLKSVSNNGQGLLSTVTSQYDDASNQFKPTFVSKFVDDKEILAIDSYYRLEQGLYNKREVIRPDTIFTPVPKTGPSNYNISELFQLLLKNKLGNEVFSNKMISNNLYRNSRLSGIKIVKSTIPYDPTNQAGFEESVIQTFHISTQQGEQDKTITLFDSQVVYGREYYYTALGVYEVDGKFYTYDNVIINSDQITEKSGAEIVDNTNETNTFINPCCEFSNENLGVNLLKNGTPLYFGQIKAANVGASEKAESEFEASKNFWEKGEKFEDVSIVPSTMTTQNEINAYNALSLNNPPGTQIPSLNGPQGILTKILVQLNSKAQGEAINNYFASYKLDPETYAKAFNLDLKTSKAVVAKRNELICFLCSRRGADPKNKIPTPARLISTRLGQTSDAFNSSIGANGVFLGGLIDCRDFGYKQANGFGGFEPDFPSFLASNDLLGDDRPKVQELDPNEVGPLYTNTGAREKKDIFKTTNNFNYIEFETNEMDSKTIVEVPLDDQKVNIVGRVPMPPDVTFVPLADVDNKILIRFLESVQADDYKQPIDAMLSFLNGTTVMEKLKDQSGSDEFVLARSQGDLDSVIMFRSDVEPNSLSDLILNENSKNVSIDWNVAEILDPVLPNKDYWYVFATRDFTGLYSAASGVFRLKLVNDSGYTYADLEPFEFAIEEEDTTIKTFKKLIKIKPSFDETLANNAEQVGTLKLFSTIKKGASKGATDAPPKFKIRVRSKKTKRAFDINLKYTQEIQQILSKKLLKVIQENAELIDEKIN